jgi:hypothetical protein
MVRCSAIKPDGTRCTLSAKGQLGVCWAHDPANRERRRMIASRGGQAKSSKELKDIKADVRAVVAGVLSEEVDLEDLARQVKELQRGYGRTA